MREWLRIAGEAEVMRRAVRYAIVVGAVLIAINHGDAIVSGNLDAVRLFRIGRRECFLNHLVASLSVRRMLAR